MPRRIHLNVLLLVLSIFVRCSGRTRTMKSSDFTAQVVKGGSAGLALNSQTRCC
uniref:Uncharacterized protein n=1 Tax=Glossina morsitans morsitans TaxID=37546 RepID=A0A905ATF3_GLOMM